MRNQPSLSEIYSGEWNPVLTGSTSGEYPGIGTFSKMGKEITLHCEFEDIVTATKPIGNYTIEGNPFIAKAGISFVSPTSPVRVTFSEVPTATIVSGDTSISLSEPVSNGLDVAITDANFVSGSPMFIRLTISFTEE